MSWACLLIKVGNGEGGEVAEELIGREEGQRRQAPFSGFVDSLRESEGVEGDRWRRSQGRDVVDGAAAGKPVASGISGISGG